MDSENQIKFLSYFETLFPNENKFEMEKIVSTFKEIEIPKNLQLLKKNEVCNKVYFICSGSVRSYFILENGMEATRYFAFENQFATALKSFITRQPSTEYLDCPSKSILMEIDYDSFQNLVNTSPIFSQTYRINLEKSYVYQVRRIEELFTLNATNRYLTLLELNPNIESIFTDSKIATFLGVSPETLSRIKKKQKT